MNCENCPFAIWQNTHYGREVIDCCGMPSKGDCQAAE